MRLTDFFILVVLLLGALVIALVFFTPHARAGSPHSEWFSRLKNGEGQLCCGDYDGVRYALPYRINGDGSATLARTEEVPASRVVPPNPTGQPLLWREPGGAVRCFSPGAAF